MTPHPTRRSVLSSVAVASAALLAGCGAFDSNPDVVVFNRTDSEQSVNVTLVDDGGEELLSEGTTIAPDEAFEQDGVLPESGTVTFSVSVDGGPSGEREFELSEAASLQAFVDADGVEFEAF